MDILESPSLHAGVLLAVVAAATAAAKVSVLSKLFRVAPAILWVFLLPATLTTAGIMPQESDFYDGCSKFLLPACLVLFLLGTDVRRLRELGSIAALAVVCGTASVILSGAICCFAFQAALGEDAWKLAAPLVGGWVGGYTSLIVVKESVQCGDEAFSPLLLVASLLAYSWVAALSCGAQFQERFDRWVKAKDPSEIQATAAEDTKSPPLSVGQFAIWTAACVILGQGLPWLATLLPAYPPVFSAKANGFLILLLVGIAAALFARVNRAFKPAAPVATYGLLLLIAIYGAKCNLAELFSTPVLACFGLAVLLVHLLLLLAAAKLFRIPLALVATASQANVGGVASAPVVASAYKPGSESIGVLMGMLAAKFGLPAGLLAAEILRLILAR